MTRPLCPYVGLQPFTETERGYFFGREREIRLITANMRVAPLTVLYGHSGVGKSSVLRAGVIPALQARAQTAVVYVNDWRSDQSLDALKLACAEAVAALPGGAGVPSAAAIDLPLDVLLLMLSDRGRFELFIVLDQFEDWLTYRPAETVATTFDEELARVINRRDPHIAMLLAVRADALFRLDRYRTRIPRLLENSLRLRHLSAEAAERAIRQPLAVHNAHNNVPIAIDDAVVDAVIGDVTAAEFRLGEHMERSVDPSAARVVEAPLLQLVMTRLWDVEVGAGSTTLRLETYERLGRSVQIAESHLDHSLTALPEPEQALCADMFQWLVTPSGHKIAQTLRDLSAYSGRPEPDVSNLLAKLGDARILRALPPVLDARGERYELFHDVLASGVLSWRHRFLAAQQSERVRRETEERLAEERRQRWKRRLDRVYRAGVAALVGLVALGIAIGIEREVHIRAQWHELNGPPGGTIAPLAIDPQVPNRLYVALYGRDGGVYRTDDGGQSWARLPVGLGQNVAMALAIDPRDPARMYLGTAGNGVIGTVDGGATWSPLNDGLFNLNVLDLMLAADDPEHILVVAYGGGGGLFSSRDHGEHWYRVNDVDTQQAFRLVSSPRDAGEVTVLSERGVFRSTDGGTRFYLLESPDVPSDIVRDWAVGSDGTRYAIVRDGKLSRKSVHDQEWVDILLPDRDDYGIRVWADTRNEGWLYTAVRSALGSTALLTSRATGRMGSWQSAGNEIGRTPGIELLTDPHHPRRVYYGTSGGLYHSNDGMTGWAPISTTLAKSTVGAILADPVDGKRIWASVEGGVYRSDNGGILWSPVVDGLYAAAVRTLAINPRDHRDVFAGVYRPGNVESIFRFHDGAGHRAWTGSANGSKNDDTRALLFRPSSVTTMSLFAGTFGSGVWHTHDGHNWEARNQGLARLDVVDLAGDALSAETLYAATGGGVYRSQDGGISWMAFNDGLEDLQVHAIAADQWRSETVFAGTARGLFVSHQGRPWRPANNGVDRTNVIVVQPDPRQADVIYIATDTGGVYRSDDGGERWVPISQTATTYAINSLTVPFSGRYALLAGAAEAGVHGWVRRYAWQDP
ncbi:hypothetical protein DCC79_00455 [bacterium]|nr:hypothetical protein [Chloroflexi bacterium CFX6]RIL12733.1 MAG: hypothetical protein DCC79_00455 [bacterium]